MSESLRCIFQLFSANSTEKNFNLEDKFRRQILRKQTASNRLKILIHKVFSNRHPDMRIPSRSFLPFNKLPPKREKLSKEVTHKHSRCVCMLGVTPFRKQHNNEERAHPWTLKPQVNEIKSHAQTVKNDFFLIFYVKIPCHILSSLTLSCKLHLFLLMPCEIVFVTDFKPLMQWLREMKIQRDGSLLVLGWIKLKRIFDCITIQLTITIYSLIHW